MADENIKKSKDSENTSDAQKKGKGSLLKFIFVPILLLAQAAGAYYIVFNILIQHPNKPEEPQKQKSTTQVGQFYEINDLVINPAGTKGRRFIVLELGLETDNVSLIEEATSKEIWIRDAIINLVAKKTPQELLDFEMRARLKKEILEVLNKKLSTGKFNQLYFKKYIMQ